MFEKNLYTLCALLSLSCSAYAIKEVTDKDDLASFSSLSVRPACSLEKSTSSEEERAERQRLEALVGAITQEKEALFSELVHLKAQIASIKSLEAALEEERAKNQRLLSDFAGVADRYGFKLRLP